LPYDFYITRPMRTINKKLQENQAMGNPNNKRNFNRVPTGLIKCYCNQRMSTLRCKIISYSGPLNLVQESISSTFYVWLFRRYFGAKKFQSRNVTREKMLNLLLYEKCALKILMKLTLGLIFFWLARFDLIALSLHNLNIKGKIIGS